VAVKAKGAALGLCSLALVLSACRGRGEARSTPTSVPPDVYAAARLNTGVPRFVFLKSSPGRDLCFRVYAAMGSGMGLSGVSGEGYSVEYALVTHSAADCVVREDPPDPVGETHMASSGTGTVSVVQKPDAGDREFASIHARLFFSGEPGWAPASEPMDADGLSIFML
jgi:hypothetical protein